MSNVERPRSLSESSDEQMSDGATAEAEEEKEASDNDQDQGRDSSEDSNSDSNSSSSDSEDSDSNSSGSSSEDEESSITTQTIETQNVSASSQPITISSEPQKNSQEPVQVMDNSSENKLKNEAFNDVDMDHNNLPANDGVDGEVPNDEEGNNDELGLPMASDLDLAQDKNIDSWGSLDEIQHFLTNSGSGPVDPVFVDHEDSQHATQMDNLVFDSQNLEDKSLEDMNEPRLESVCNSTINSAENSVILGNDFEDGEIASDDNLENERNTEKMESIKLVIDKAKLSLSSQRSRPPHSDDDAKEKKKVKKKKKDRKRKKDVSRQSDESEDENSFAKISALPRSSKKSKMEVEEDLTPVIVNNPSTTAQNNPREYQTKSAMSVVKSTDTGDSQHVGTKRNLPNPHDSKSSTNPTSKFKTNPPLPSPPAPTSEAKVCPMSRQKPPPPPAEAPHIKSESSSPKSDGDGKRSKKLSIKDYKAKKEAERLRLSVETSGSESQSSSTPSKEPSPAPEAGPQQPPARAEDVSQEDNTDDMEVEDTAGADLQDFDILDEIEDGDSDNDISKDSDDDEMDEDDTDSLAEDEVDQMLEANVKNPDKQTKEDIVPQEKLRKLVLEERGQNVFEVLPQGWVSVTHNSGIPLYLHRETRVVTASKPYDLGNGSVRKHNVPISAIPCYAYKYYGNSNNAPAAKQQKPGGGGGDATISAPPAPQSAPAPVPAASCPYSGTSSFRENASPDSTTDTKAGAAQSELPSTISSTMSSSPTPSSSLPTETPSAAPEAATAAEDGANSSNMFPKAQISTIEESLKESELSPEEVTKYCKKIFVFKELEVAKFKTWKERRAYFKQSHKKKIEKEILNRPTLPEGTKIITIPSLELSNLPGTEGESALNQKVVKKSKKKWIINPVGKSMVCLLHEYVQQSLKTQPYYQFTELDNAATPYAAIVRINDIEYGRGTGSSKKIAKSEAARRTLEMLIPQIKDKLPNMAAGVAAEGDAPDLSFFDGILVEDGRVADLCNRTSEPAPYQILVTCLQRNYGLGDTHIHQEMRAVRNGKNEYTMVVNKREVAVICKNKKDGKQLAAQKLLQQLHPHITSWGSLLRMYGNRSLRKLKMKKEKETEVTGLQTRSSQANVAPSLAILDKLREEMRNLRESKQNIVPIGKFVVSLGDGVGPGSGLNTDQVDL